MTPIWKKAFWKAVYYAVVGFVVYVLAAVLSISIPIVGMICLFAVVFGGTLLIWAYTIVAYMRAEQAEKDYAELKAMLVDFMEKGGKNA